MTTVLLDSVMSDAAEKKHFLVRWSGR